MFGLKWIVTAVEPQDDYTLILTYKNGKKRLFDFKPLLNDEMNAPLKDLALFRTARVHHHTVMWTDRLDICPEYLYEHSKAYKN